MLPAEVFRLSAGMRDGCRVMTRYISLYIVSGGWSMTIIKELRLNRCQKGRFGIAHQHRGG